MTVQGSEGRASGSDTEQRLGRDDQNMLDRLRALRNLGVRLSVDDFGTGPSPIAYLKRFPLDVSKIDRSLVEGINVNSDDSAIVRALIAMAHCLQLEVTAEGVETKEQRAFLERHGCDELRGFPFGAPAAARVCRRLLGERNGATRPVPVVRCVGRSTSATRERGSA